MWKQGQIVTVCGKKCRVKSAPGGYFACNKCALENYPQSCDRICFSKDHKLDDYQYLEEIKSCGNKDNT